MDICFEYGLEVENSVGTDYVIQRDAKGEEIAPKDEDFMYFKFEVPANRYDLLCLEGLS